MMRLYLKKSCHQTKSIVLKIRYFRYWKTNAIYSVQLYQPSYKSLWDTFVSKAKNGTFLFYRDFMEYHKDRFRDFSLMIFQKDELFAIIPANKSKDEVFSHQGLTFGGILLPFDIATETVFEIMDSVLDYLNQSEINSFTACEICFCFIYF